MPGCNEFIVDAKGLLLGQIAHISGFDRKSIRFDENLSNEDRRHYDNLMILCFKHHTEIDAHEFEVRWPTPTLKGIKAAHEAPFRDLVGRLVEPVRDRASGTTWKSPQNLGRVLGFSGFTEEEVALQLDLVEGFAKKLADLPREVRSLLVLMVHRGKAPSPMWHGRTEIEISWNKLTSYASWGDDVLWGNFDLLREAGLADLDREATDSDGVVRPEAQLFGSTPDGDWKLFEVVKDLAGDDVSVIHRVLHDLDFTLFDEPES